MPSFSQSTWIAGTLLLVLVAAASPAPAVSEKPDRPAIHGQQPPLLSEHEALELRVRQRAEAGSVRPGPTEGITALPLNPDAPASGGGRFSDDVILEMLLDPSFHARQCVSADGTIYAVVLTSTGEEILNFRSRDGGRSWSDFGGWLNSDTFGPPDIAVAGGNQPRLIVVVASGERTVNASLHSLTIELDDESYGPQAVLEDDPNIYYYYPRICVDSPEYSLWYPYVVYHAYEPTNSRLRFARSTDFGANWQEPVELSGNAAWYQPPSLDFGGSVLTVAYTADSPADVYLTQSGDFGTTFTPATPVAATALEESRPVVASANDGSLTVVAFTRFYPGSLSDIDCVWNDGGAIWNSAYLPYTEFPEGPVDLQFSPDSALLHATYLSRARVVYSQADSPVTIAWSDPCRINDSEHNIDADPQIVAWNTPCGCDPDLTCDGTIDAWDRLALETAIDDPHGYQNMFPDCDIAAGDLDCNGVLDAADLACFDGGLNCCPGGEYKDANVLWPGGQDPVVILADQVRTYFPDPLSAAPNSEGGARLEAPRPNPFNARTSIAFHLESAGRVKLEIFAADGRRLRVLAEGPYPAGSHTLEWNGRDSAGRDCASGIYLARLRAAGGVAQQRMVLVK